MMNNTTTTIPKKPYPSPLIYIGIPAGVFFSNFAFKQIGFNLEDFKTNLNNRYIVTDPLFNPKWELSLIHI